MKKPKALILCGDGINCELETEFALQAAGFDSSLTHVSNLLRQPQLLHGCQMLVLPGGFSFGDEIASGKVLAIKLKEYLNEILVQYIESSSLLLGSCNGFQVLVQMGILPGIGPNGHLRASLIHNSSGKFINRWVTLEVDDSSPSLFLAGLKTIELPIRHGEGRLFIESEAAQPVKQKACLRYLEDVNGSFDRIAALSNTKGNVLGLMPHPEAYVRWTQHPAWTSHKQKMIGGPSGVKDTPGRNRLPDGLIIFENAAKAICGR